ncbi:MAG TPA: efflux RND transporter periplasmic adaptor subunit [Bryobacteraceae bacterium]|jgi:multidrug efflux system membrane fusion protein
MSERLLPFRILALSVSILLAGCETQKTQSAGPPPPTPVSISVAAEQSVPTEVQAVGTVESSDVIQVKSQISGELVKVAFAEGTDVKEGDLLFEIDARPYQETLRQAEAALNRDTANLHQAEANREKDVAQTHSLEADASRNTQLAKEGIVSHTQDEQSRAAFDSNRAAINADQAAIESYRASIDSDHSAIDRAKLDLTYCQIRSRVTGRAGNLLVHEGNIISANTTNLVVINKLDPIWVSFGVPEENLASVQRSSAGRKLAVLATPKDTQNPTPVRGELSVIDNTVDSTTGTIKLKATFDNSKRALWPGQFVNVSLTLATQARAIVVPSEAVQPGQQGQMVYVVKPDQTVEPRNVKAGAIHGNQVVIESGLAAGETVVTDGQLRLYPGAHIQPVAASKVDSRTL